MRLFFAVDLPGPVRDALASAQRRLRERTGDGVRWTRPDTLHLTLKFLGDAGGVDGAARVLDAAAAGLPRGRPIELAAEGLGSFGGRRPRVVWAGLTGPGLERLGAVAAHLDAALTPLGFPGDGRGFHPHVTLGRARDRGRRRGRGQSGGDLAAALREVTLEPQPFEAHQLVLYSSSYGEARGAVRYEAVGRLSLLAPGFEPPPAR